MHIQVLGSYGGESAGCRMTCLRINGTVALDAGSLSQALDIDQQAEVHSIVLTHSHMDHTASLPFFIENVFGKNDRPIDLYSSPETSFAIRRYLFNNATWPDFTRLPNHLLPAVRFHDLADEVPIELDGITFTPIAVNHVIPTFGFLIEHAGRAVVWSSDTGPTQRLWEVANRTRGLAAVCIETSFDNSMQEIADLSRHLTPHSLERELGKLEKKVPILVHHLKPPCIDDVRRELVALANPDLELLEQGRTYEF